MMLLRHVCPENVALEQQLPVLIKQRVRIDRTDWLEALLSSGDWSQICKLRRGFCPKQSHLLDSVAQTVDSDDGAEVFAEHFEKTHWSKRIVTQLSSQEFRSNFARML